MDFGTGTPTAKLPRFDNSMHNRSPISLLSTGQLKIQWSMFWEDRELSKKFSVELHAPADFNKKELNGVKIIGLPTWKKETDRKLIRKKLWSRLKKNKKTNIISWKINA